MIVDAYATTSPLFFALIFLAEYQIEYFFGVRKQGNNRVYIDQVIEISYQLIAVVGVRCEFFWLIPHALRGRDVRVVATGFPISFVRPARQAANRCIGMIGHQIIYMSLSNKGKRCRQLKGFLTVSNPKLVNLRKQLDFICI